MGAFFLVHRSCGDFDALTERLQAGFARQGFRDAGRLTGPDWLAGTYHPLAGGTAVSVDDGGHRGFCAGTLFYAGLGGEPALRRLLADHRAGSIAEASLYGSFAALLVGGDRAVVLTDRTGTLHVYQAHGGAALSTSVLALAEALPGLTVDEDGLYDYVLQGAPMGPLTLFREIGLLDGERLAVFAREVRQEPRAKLPTIAAAASRGLADAAGRCVALLRDRFAAAAAWPEVDTALSGGYDSRLLLALAWDAGLQPRVHVYGRAGDPDVACARTIAEAEGFRLDHTDKSLVALPPPERFAELVAANYLAFDGYPTDGIFDNGTDLATRRARMAGGALMLNGGGGEIFRNFFYLPDRPISALKLAWTFYCQFDSRTCTNRFDENVYLGRLAERLRIAVGGGDPLTRRQMEAAYPRFRCRYWTGHNNSLNNRLGFSWTPFIDPVAVETALGLPLALKNTGRLEAEMIAQLSPRLAAYPSSYGRSFDRPPPLSHRLKDLANRWRPPLLRRYSYRLKRRGGTAFAGALDPSLLATAIDPELPYLRTYFRVERIGDPMQLQRIATAEYMFERLQPRSR